MARSIARGGCVCSVLAVYLVGLAWLAPQAAAQGAPAAEDPFGGPPAAAKAAQPPSDTDLEKHIRLALEQPTHMEFVEMPLADAVEYLKDLHGIEIQLDGKELEEAGIGSDTPMTRTLKGISLGSALHLLLRPLDCTTVVRDGVLLITTRQAERQMLTFQVYHVKDLVQEGSDVDDLAEILRLVLPCATASTCSDTGVRGAKPSGFGPQASSLAQIVPFGSLIVARASINEQITIADLLAEMRAKTSAGTK